MQANLEILAAEAAERRDGRVSVAIVVADSRDGSILAQVGSPGFVNHRRAGWIDMSIARRSPGSALKPFIYGLAFEEGLVLPETLISDRPADFAGYRPRNFDMTFQGDVTVREALQLSLNVPAVRLLDGVGPARLTAGAHASRAGRLLRSPVMVARVSVHRPRGSPASAWSTLVQLLYIRARLYRMGDPRCWSMVSPPL